MMSKGRKGHSKRNQKNDHQQQTRTPKTTTLPSADAHQLQEHQDPQDTHEPPLLHPYLHTEDTSDTSNPGEADDAHLRRQIETAACEAIPLYLQRRQFTDVHPHATDTYRYPLTERTRSVFRIPAIISPITGAEATHLEVAVSVEDAGATWDMQVSWIVPFVPQSDMTSAEVKEMRGEVIRLTWVHVSCIEGVVACTDMAEQWRSADLPYFAAYAFYAACSGWHTLPPPVKAIFPTHIIAAPSDPSAA